MVGWYRNGGDKMAYFPLFAQLAGRRVLVAGGGRIALKKTLQLLEFGADVVVCAPSFLQGFEKLAGTEKISSCYSEAFLQGCFLVIAATNDPDLNAQIFRDCEKRSILCCSVDDPANCSFIFPAVIHQKNLCVAVSTGGASPAAAGWLKEKIAEDIPDYFDSLLEWLHGLRKPVLEQVKDPALRKAFFQAAFKAGLEKNGPLSNEETEQLFENIRSSRSNADPCKS